MSDFETLTFSRILPAQPDRVYRALTSAQDRMVWGSPEPDTVVLIEGQPDPAPGVRETSRCGPRDNPYVTVLTDWVLMEPGERVVYAETLMAEGAPLGVTLATYEMAPDGTGTSLLLTLQIASFIGAEMLSEFESGWTHAVDNLTRHLEGEMTCP